MCLAINSKRLRLIMKVGFFLYTVLFSFISTYPLMSFLQLDMKIVLETIRKPLAPVIGFGTQFIAMPLASCIFIIVSDVENLVHQKNINALEAVFGVFIKF